MRVNSLLKYQSHTNPSLSGTFGIPTRLTLNPKMPKEPSSPSHTDTPNEIQLKIKDLEKLIKRNNGQRTTTGHTQLPCLSVADVSSFGYLSGNTTSERTETATAHTGERYRQG